MAKVRQNVNLISRRQCWLRTLKKPLLRDRDYFMIIWHQNFTVHEFVIPKEVTLSCKSAYSKYKAAMESARAETVSKSCGKKRKILIDEIANVKRSKVTLESCVTTLLKDADALSLECENKQDPVEIIKLVKSNSFRKTAIEKEKAISELKETITKLEMT